MNVCIFYPLCIHIEYFNVLATGESKESPSTTEEGAESQGAAMKAEALDPSASSSEGKGVVKQAIGRIGRKISVKAH